MARLHPGTLTSPSAGARWNATGWKSSSMRGAPLQVAFSLAETPAGEMLLHLDAIVRHRRPAAPRYVVSGERPGGQELPLSHVRPPNCGGRTAAKEMATSEYFGYASLESFWRHRISAPAPISWRSSVSTASDFSTTTCR